MAVVGGDSPEGPRLGRQRRCLHPAVAAHGGVVLGEDAAEEVGERERERERGKGWEEEIR